MAGERQSVPARHGIATFVPKGHSIKIINTYGTQVIDTWAFALHKPPNEESDAEEKAEEEAINQAQQEAEKEIEKEQKSAADDIKDVEVAAEKKDETPDIPKTAVKDKPEAPQATAGAEAPPATATKPTTETVDGKKVRTWASYVPSVPSVAVLRSRRNVSTSAQGKDATNTVNEQATGATSKEGDNNKGEEQKEQKAEGSAGAQVAGDTTPTRPESEGVKVAGTITPSDKSEDEYADAKSVQSSKSWGSYLPSIRSRAKAAYGVDQKAGTDPKESKGNTKSWSSYLPSGTSFTSYLPNSGKDALSAFASSHHRDPNKSYAEQLYEFSKTPVGAASLSAATGSGTAGSLYAAYTAYTKLQASQRRTGPMEYLSLPHTIDASQNLSPTEGDALLSNLHGPLLTLLEDTSPATTENVDPSVIPLRHGSILPACDPTTYKELAEEGEKGEEHGSCAENLVLALQEFNKSTGLKGARTVGADVTINSAPVPLMLFMNATVNPGTGKVVVQEPRKYQGGKWGKGGEKGGYVKLRAERDVVVVMSACPMDMGPTNSGRSMAANFIVEEPSDEEKVELKKDEEKQKEKQKPKVQTTSEKINAQKNEVKKAAPTQDVKKAAPKQEIKKAAPKQEIKKAAPKQEVKKTVENEKRRDSAHGAVGGAAAKPTRPSLEDKTKFSSSGVQTPRTETSATSNEPIRNVPKPGKKRPKKLDRRSSSMAPTPA